VRQLSRELVVNPNTVARAYTELEREGTLVTQQGRGAFVAEPRTDLTKKARRKQLGEQLDLLFVEAVHLGFTSEELLMMVQSRIEQFSFVEEGSGRK
jgi:GntR family transcriptional regulator